MVVYKTEFARCAETKNEPELGHPLINSKRSLGNAPFLGASFFLAEKGTVWVRVSNHRYYSIYALHSSLTFKPTPGCKV